MSNEKKTKDVLSTPSYNIGEKEKRLPLGMNLMHHKVYNRKLRARGLIKFLKKSPKEEGSVQSYIYLKY